MSKEDHLERVISEAHETIYSDVVGYYVGTGASRNSASQWARAVLALPPSAALMLPLLRALGADIYAVAALLTMSGQVGLGVYLTRLIDESVRLLDCLRDLCVSSLCRRQSTGILGQNASVNEEGTLVRHLLRA